MALHLQVVTPKGKALEATVDEVSVPGALGEFGILEGHIPVLSALKAGVVHYTSGGKTGHLAVGGRGYVEIAGEEKVMVISDSCMTSDDVDADMAKEELAEAQARLASYEGTTDDAEYQLIEQKINWAQARLALLSL
jgi:F-type H+-transporting ATPase subunit epsilon